MTTTFLPFMRHNWSQDETPHIYILENQADYFRKNINNLLKLYVMIHIGKLVRTKLRERAHTCVWLAEQMGCSRTNLYKIFNKQHVNSRDLEKLSVILNYNFFEVLSNEIQEELDKK